MQTHLNSILHQTIRTPNPYLRALECREMSLDAFTETQVQFFFAVRHFRRPMKKLADRIPEDRNRALILQNVRDELGNGNQALSHENTFLLFLNRLSGLTPEAVRARSVWEEIHTFNSALDKMCENEDYRKSVALMAMIEWMFSGISGQIGQAVLEMGWLQKEQLVHYTTHQDLDIQHAKDFIDVIQPDWGNHRQLILEGMRDGALIFDSLYRNLHTACQKRSN